MTHTLIGVSPLGAPDPRLVAAVCRAGGSGVLDLGPGARAAREALTLLRQWAPGRHCVRVPADCALRPEELWAPAPTGTRRTAAPAAAGPCTVLLAPDAPWTVAEVRAAARAAAADPAVLAEVRGTGEAVRAVADGVTGLVVRGEESGGPCGEHSTFVLLQRVLGAVPADLPVWACGGIGPHTAAAAVLAGARGVVLDIQLALLDEAGTAPAAAGLLRAADGTETVVVDGCRVLDRSRPGLPAALRDRPLPLGQDAFLAARFAERYGTVDRALAAVTEGIDAAVADDGAVLRGGSPMCRALGTALPVVQGPMTRVSDQARFAAAVADGGGLPVVALALAGPEQTRTLLEQTKSALGDRSWGVGILGFVPEETRTAQLEAIRELRPSHAVIAGGRPSQAAALEAEGIRTFLHVPSPGLLGQFLAAGARRFVFEGAECGGHIGPRNSFPLWEAQLAVLEDFLDAAADDGHADGGDAADPQDVQVLFAGGIHDERSAAMVAALAAPLTTRGAVVGVLMGTGYLFTEEAVECGAIRPLFQRAALDARSTTLLHTAPGHATRCLPSAFSDTYQEVKDELRTQGIPERQVWQELERLNVGRLRIASKGVERVGDELLDVDEERQREAGMFMAGEVAVLRSAVTTVAALHHAVTDGAADFYGRRTAELAAAARDAGGTVPARNPAPAPEPLDIAVVGMAGMFPGAADLPAYWAQVLAGADAITEVPDTRWDPALHFGADAEADDVSASKWGGFLPPIPFDPLAYGIPPASLAAIEPVQLLALEAARRALADAGLDRRAFPRERTCVVFGAEAGSDISGAATLRSVLPSYVGRLPEDLEEQLPKLTEDSFPGMLANVIAGRIANRLDLGGANYTVDAACASSLAAVDAACKELACGAADVALCGGADLHNGINDYLLFSSAHALSPTGRCRTFDAAADGIALGEGVACLVLKRRADAERDGDRIYAVIEGVGSASDGRSLGLTAPRPEGQRAALERAYAQARVSPAEVGLIEAHGTGTVVGDRTELSTLTRLFEEAGAAPGGCVVGSVKSQIGHTKCAAGLAGLIKTALALHTGVRPPTLHIDVPNPVWTGPDSPFVFHSEARPWAEPAARRVAGVSAFGFGGTNFHAVLRAHADAGAPPRQSHDVWPAELFVFRTRAAAEELAGLAASGHWRLRDLARTAAQRAETGPGPLLGAVVAESVTELPHLIRDLLDGTPGRSGVFPATGAPAGAADGDGGKVAFLFPGQGSQRPGMFAELFTAFPELGRHLYHAPAAALFPPAAFDAAERAAQVARLTDTRHAQPALGAVGLAAYDTLTAVGVRPDMAAGHSYGELVALCAAGALDPDKLGDLSRERAEAILAAIGAQGSDPGTMAAAVASAEQVTRVLAGGGLAERVVVANHNAPAQSVLSGPRDAVAEAVDALTAAGFSVRPLPVACAFHSPLVAGAVSRFAEILTAYAVRGPEFPVWANLTGTRYAGDPARVRADLAEQIAAPVRFADQIDAMYDAGARIFVECGPGTVLTGLVGQILGDRPHVAVPFEPRPDAGLRGHLEALARLAAAGVPVAPARLFSGRDTALADPAAVPERPGWTVDGHLVRTADGRPVPGALRPARRISGIPRARERTSEATTMGEREELLREFLRNSREMLAAQRDVLLGYFGAPPAPQAAPPTPEPLPAPAPAALAAAPAPAPAPVVVDVLAEVLAVIAERTGYPVEMVGAESDLEADLSVDSIKRTEIAGELGRRLLGSGADLRSLPDADLEELTRERTAAGIADWLRARAKALADPDPAPALATSAPVAGESPDPLTGQAPRRYLLRPAPLDPPPVPGAEGAAQLRGKRFLIVADDTPLARALVTRLTTLGALAARGGPDTAQLARHTGPVDGVLHLGALAGTEQQLLPAKLTVLQELLLRGPRRLLCPRLPDDTSGLDGFVRTAAREYPDTVVRTVELDPDEPATEQAEALVGELLAPDREPVVLRTCGVRRAPVPYESPLGPPVSSGAGPASSGAAAAAALGLGPESVVVLAGGARGITARFTLALAAAARCRVELLGRTPLDDGTGGHHELAHATDLPALRAALAARGGMSTAEIDREAGRVLARREIAATLAEVHDAGGRARYRALDLRDAEAVQQAVKETYATYGRIDGVVHAAGVIEDRLLAEKDPVSFERVYGTKVDGARALLSALRRLPQLPAFTVMFGSVAAVYGNRGQADYAAANDALARLGRLWRADTGSRTVTVHWGPWAPAGAHGGMVGPELGREYARRGIELIDPEEGVLALLRELAWGEPETDEVVLTASGR